MKRYDDVIQKLREDCKGLDMAGQLSLVGNAQAMLAWMRVQELEAENQRLREHQGEVDIRDRLRRASEALNKAVGERTSCPCEAVGLSQIAERLGVQRETAVRWNYRKLLPDPQWRVSRDPAWCWPHQVVPWAQRTNRLAG